MEAQELNAIRMPFVVVVVYVCSWLYTYAYLLFEISYFESKYCFILLLFELIRNVSKGEKMSTKNGDIAVEY